MTPELDADLAGLLDEVRVLSIGPEVGDTPPDVLRRQMHEWLTHVRGDHRGPFDGDILDQDVRSEHGPVPVRLYEPRGRPRDVVVFLHGGGWVLGDRDTADPAARALAHQLQATVVSVDYRRAPEHAFPAALDDCLAVATAMSRERQPRWFGLAGDSAGGNLAAAVSLAAPTHGLRVDGQLLIYPAVDGLMSADSHERFATGYHLTAAAMRYYWDSYGRGTELDHPLLSPSYAPDLARLPPTVITTAGFDPLHDEGQRFAAQMVASDVLTIHLPAPTLTHGWLDMVERVPAARLARQDAYGALDFLRLQHLRDTAERAVVAPTGT